MLIGLWTSVELVFVAKGISCSYMMEEYHMSVTFRELWKVGEPGGQSSQPPIEQVFSSKDLESF